MSAASAAAIRTRQLTKFYGKHRGIVELDLVVPRGEIFGFLGPNGAGKTTTIRTLLDLIRPTSGTAEVLGLDSHRDSLEIRQRVGYLPGEFALYEHLTGAELVDYFGALRNVPVERARLLADRMDVDLTRRIGTLSKGNKQKVAIVQALMHAPELLILDEPTSGLDPLVQHTFHELLQELIAEGGTVFLSSHVLSEIEHVAHHVAIVRDGRLIVVEDINDLKQKALRRLEVHFSAPVSEEEFSGIQGVRAVRVVGEVASFDVEGSPDALLKAVTRHEIVDLISHEPDLEEIFLAYYRTAPDAA